MVLVRYQRSGPPTASAFQKYFGKYRGVVTLIDEQQSTSLQDHQCRGRLRALVPAVFGNTKLCSWALPSFPLAGGVPGDKKRLGDEFGIFYMPRPGDVVWIEFEQGDQRKPIWTGFVYPTRDEDTKRVGIPSLARGIDDGTIEQPKLAPGFTYDSTATGIPTPDPDVQPGNDYAAKYPYNIVFKSRSGVTIEIDDTKGSSRIRVYHPSGAQIQFRNDGSLRVYSPNEIHYVCDGKMTAKAPVVEIGAGDLMDAEAGCQTGRTQPTCQVTGLPLGHSKSVRANS